MRFVAPPTADSPARGQSGDDLDGLLGQFFRAEMPNPWPAAPIEEEQPAILARPLASRRSQPLFRSRLALAASVAFLLALPWLIADSFQAVTPDASDVPLTGVSANRDVKYKTTLEVQRSGETGIRIEMRLPDELKDMLP
jgi:hypothetical protein